jgi:hypothetical protein
LADPARLLEQPPPQFLVLIEMILGRKPALRHSGQQHQGDPTATLHLATPQFTSFDKPASSFYFSVQVSFSRRHRECRNRSIDQFWAGEYPLR